MRLKRTAALAAAILLLCSALGMGACTTATPAAPEHDINKSVWKSDDTAHWHDCNDCIKQFDYAAHSYASDTATECSVCGRARSSGIEEKGVFEITFNALSGSFPDGKQKKSFYTSDGVLSAFPQDPVWGTAKFDGWYTQPNGGGDEIKSDHVFTDITDLYAKWTGDPGKYDIVFYATLGEFPDKTTSKQLQTGNGKLSGLPDEPVLSGYDFAGWYTGEDGEGTKVETGYTFTESMAVYADWTKRPPGKFDIVFSAAPGKFGDTSTSKTVLTIDGHLTSALPQSPTSTKPFRGWYTGPNGTGTKVTSSYIFMSPCTVYAYYSDTAPAFTPLSLNDIVTDSAGNYGYNWLGEQTNGANLQEFYRGFEDIEKAIYNNTAYFEKKTGTTGDHWVVGASSSKPWNEIALTKLTKEESVNVYNVYLYDHPYAFWDGKYYFWGTTTSMRYIRLTVGDDYCEGNGISTNADRCNAIKAKAAELNGNINRIYEKAAGETSAYNAAAIYYRELAAISQYTNGSDGKPASSVWAHSIIGLFDNDDETGPVCECYARCFQLLLNLSGIENVYCLGQSYSRPSSTTSGGHAWNMIKLNDNKWYYCDLTWDDNSRYDTVDYEYFVQARGERCNGYYFYDTHRIANPAGENGYYLYDIPTVPNPPYSAANEGGFKYGAAYTVDGVKYVRTGANSVYVSQVPDADDIIVIPDSVTIKGINYTVTGIGYGGQSIVTATVPVIVPETVTLISYHAFFDMGTAPVIYYRGTQAQWNGIKIYTNAYATGATPTVKYSGRWEPFISE